MGTTEKEMKDLKKEEYWRERLVVLARNNFGNIIKIGKMVFDRKELETFIEEELKSERQRTLEEVGVAFSRHREVTGCNIVADDCTWEILEDLYEGGKGVSRIEGGNKYSDKYDEAISNLINKGNE